MVTCALVVGHRKGSPGAINEATGMSEFAFNADLAEFIAAGVGECKVRVVYRSSYQKLPGDINELKPDFIIALHCNAYDEKDGEKEVGGTETLYYHKSERSKELAGVVQGHVVDALRLKDRGIRPRRVEDRGGYLLKYTNAPCIILEPVFIDNNHDLERARSVKDQLAFAIIKAINDYAVAITHKEEK